MSEEVFKTKELLEPWSMYTKQSNPKLKSKAFCFYLKRLLKATKKCVTPPPSLPLDRNPFGLLQPSVAFGISDKALSLHEFPAVVEALDHHVQLLAQHLPDPIVRHLPRDSADHPVGDYPWEQAEMLGHVLCCLAGFPGNYLYLHNRKSGLLRHVLVLFLECHKLVVTMPSEEIDRHLLVAMCYMLGFVHHVLDPGHRWKHLFIMDGSKDSPTHISQADIQDVPEELSQLFISVFKEPSLPPLCPTELSSMQMEMLHVIGAAATGLMGSAKLLVTPEVINQLLALLHPSRNSGCGPTQALTIKVFIKVLHVLHCFMPKEEQVEVDTGVTLSKLFSVLPYSISELKPEQQQALPTFFVLLLNSISLLMDAPKGSTQLKELFAEVGCFEKLVESFKELKNVPLGGLGTTLVCLLIRTLTVALKGSSTIKASFRQHIKYSVLKKLMASLTPPTMEVLQELLNMALEVTESTECSSPLVCNADALGLCLEWLVDLPHSLQVWLSSRVLDLSSSSVYNKQQCCGARLASVAVQVLARSQEAGGFAEEIEDNLLRLIEGLGTHSIMGTELKDILVSLRPVKCGENLELPTYYFKLQYVLSALANKENGIQSLYYFELRQPKSHIHIAVPEVVQPNQYAFSFHCWVSLDQSCADGDQRNMRRMLYSFYAGSTGFEAFFTKDLVLVVAVHSKKRGLKTVSLTEPLTPQKWHSVCVVYSSSKKHSDKVTIQVLVDGLISATDGIRAVPLANTFTECRIGWSHDSTDNQLSAEGSTSPLESPTPHDIISPLRLDECITSFGSVTNFGGCIGPVCLFSDTLNHTTVQLLHSRGPNDLSIFQTKADEWKTKLIFYYHPKACKDKMCVDLSPSHAVHGTVDAVLNGDVYVIRDVKLVLSSLGGVEVFFPILEQAGLPLRQREAYSIIEPPRPKASEFWNTESEAIAYLFKLLASMLANAPINEQVFYTVKGPATIGALLQKVPPSLLTVAAHSAIQSLVEQLSPDQPEQQTDLYSSLLFNYRIWSRADYSVQLSHSKYLSTLVSLKLDDCRKDFGVQFVLDVIREYYNPSSAINPKLSIEEKYQIRKSLMSIVDLYFAEDELDAILGFLCAVNDEILLDEMLQYLLGLLTTPIHQNMLSTALWEKGVVFLVRIQAQDLDVRLTTIKLLAVLSRRQGHTSAAQLYKLMHSGALSAALRLMHQQQLSSTVILALLDLCIVKNNVDCTDYISNFVAYAGTLQLLRHAPLFVRHTSCLELQSLLDTNPDHALKMAQISGWERILLWLLTPPQADSRWQQSSAHKSHPSYKAILGRPGEEEPPAENILSISPNTVNLCTSPVSSADVGPGSGSGSGSGSGAGPGAILGGNNNQLDSEKEIFKLFNVVIETIELILWNTTDPMEADGYLRRGWSQFFITVDLFATEHSLVVPAYTIKQRLFTLLLEDVKKHCSSGNILNSVVLQLTQLFEAFVIASYPSLDVEEDCEVAVLTFSHNPTFELHKDHCTPELLKLFVDTLKATRILDRHAQLPEELQVVQSYLRILMACTNSSDRQYSVFCLNILQLGWLPEEDVRFIFLNLAKELSEALKKDQTDKIGYITATMRCLLTIYAEPLKLQALLPSLQSTASLSFADHLVEYSKTQEWNVWLDELRVKQMLYHEVLEKWLKALSVQTKKCRQICSESEIERKEDVVKYLELYEINVLQKYNILRDSEITRHRTLDIQRKNELSTALQKWSSTRRFLTGECGAWKSRDPDLYLWKMDRTENFSRMRLKLARNYNYNKHTDASQHSSGETPLVSSTADTSLLAMATATKSPSEEEEEHLFDQIQKLARDEPAVALEKGKKEKLIIREMCQLVTVVEVISGTLDITNKCIYFVSDPQDKDYVPWYPIDFKIPHSQLREVHPRRFNMSHTALEMFLVDRSNHFLNFASKKSLRNVCSSILQLDAPNLIKGSLTQKPAKLVQSLGLTQKWVKREITNFDYIMQLNTISGRTYNDLNQYPIFPWILRDYSCDTLDLSNSEVFRDLSKPMGIQNPDLEEKVQTKYEEFDDPVMGKFHYGTHYSNAATVIHYLIRLEPFTSLHINLQSGMFDHPDRQFFSIPNAWSNIYLGSDVKELIPEFFCLPDFLRNVNGYDLGVTQDKTVVGDVILPKWASSPEDFIRQHREALESEYVSAHLNEWIDLIFGYKQTGPEAEKAMNVFNKYSYQENVNLDNIQDPKSRREIESIITNFGQTPTRLFNERHPTRDPPVKSYRGYSSPFTGKRVIVNLFEQMQVVRKGDDQRGQTRDDLMANVVEVLPNDPIVFIGSPGMQSRALIVSGNPETLVTISQKGLLGIHGWLPFSNNKQRSFTFHPDTNTSSDRSKCPCLGGPFDKDLQVSSHMFALSSNNKLLLSAGHWDNSFRTYSLEKNKMVARTMHHTAVVTCMAVDRLGTEDLLITGSKDTTCVIWKFSKHDPPSRPQQTLYGHDAEVLCVDICSELDLAISGAKNGVCLVHTIRSGQLVHKLTPKKSCEIRHVAVSTTGVMVVYSVGSRSTGAAAVEPCLHLYSINGRLLEEKKLSKPLSSIVVEGKWIISGNELGVLTFRDLFSFKQHNALDLSASIRSISPVLDYQTKLCTHLLVGLHNGKLIIVSPKDSSVI